jgi:hypothetical protein
VAKAIEGKLKVNEVMKELSKDSTLKENIKIVASFVARVSKALNKLPNKRKTRIAKVKLTNEKEFIEGARDFLERRFHAEIAVYSEEDEASYDPKHRAGLAIPTQPAIYIE